MSLTPLLRWPGGQSGAARQLRGLYPKHDTYVEPFAGGAAFLFAKDPVPTEVIGDTNTWLMGFYDSLRRGNARKCSGGFKFKKSEFEKAKRGRSVCDRLAVSAMGFQGRASGFDNASAATRSNAYGGKLKKLDRYEKRLSHVHLTKRSFDTTMRKFDGPDTWHLLDPPWPDMSETGEYQGKLTVTPAKVAKVVGEMEGTVWVLYNDHPDVREAFCDQFHCYNLKVKSSASARAGGTWKQKGRLLISNRPVRGMGRQLSGLEGLDDLAAAQAKVSNERLIAIGVGAFVTFMITTGGDVGESLLAAGAGALATKLVEIVLS